MHIKSIMWLLVLTVTPLLAQEDDASVEPAEQSFQEQSTQEQELQKPAAVEAKASNAKAGGNFQPSEEIMADTMLTLPADI